MKSAVVANSALTDIFDANSFYQFSLTKTALFPVVLHLFANPQSAASGDARGEIKRVPCQSMTDFFNGCGWHLRCIEYKRLSLGEKWSWRCC